MYFHVYSFKLQIHAHIYRSFIRHHKMLGVRIAKRKTSLKSEAKANPCGTKLRTRILFGAGKFASQTYPAGELKSRGNPAKVSPANIPFLVDNRKCCIFFVNTKQKETPPTRVVFLFGALSICVANRPPAAAFIKKRRETREGFPRKHPLPYGRLRILYSLDEKNSIPTLMREAYFNQRRGRAPVSNP